MTDKLPLYVLLLVATILVGNALITPVAAHKGTLVSDEATYYAMAYSLAFDGDIRYQAHDLEYVYDRGYEGGPTGVFLQRNADNGRLYYAKAMVYSLAAAPFVRLLGDNGFLLLHALLLSAVLLAGYAYLARTMAPAVAAAWSLAYFLGSIAFLYYFWFTPEIFNLSLGFLATFLWLYKERPPGWPADATWQPTGPLAGAGHPNATWQPTGPLAGAWTDVAAALLYGVAAYSKPPSIILVGPLLLWMLLRRRRGRAVALGLVAALTVIGLFAATHVSTGNWNYMGGDRRSFTADSPFQYRDRPFDAGTEMITEVSAYRDRLPRPDHLAADLLAYVWVGRNAGLLIYMLPAVLAALAWASSRGRFTKDGHSARHRRLSPHTLLIAAAALNALAYMTVVQANWIGGGGTIGSRYFMNLYYAPFFAIPAGAGLLGPLVAGVVWALFLSPIVLDPYAASRNPGRHTQHPPFTLLPVEMGMLNDLPFNTNPDARRVELPTPDGTGMQKDFDLYFLDDNTYLREPALPGFWVKSRSRAEVVLRAAAPLETLRIDLINGPVDNEVTVSIDGQAETVELAIAERSTIRFQPTTRFTFGDNWVYRLVIDSRSGGVPMLYSDENEDFRRLGVFVAPGPEFE